MAITFGGISSVSTSQTPTSVDVSGSDTLGIVYVVDGNGGSNEITGVTWDSSPMTKISSIQNPGDRWLSVWYIVNPTASSTISFTGGSYWRSFSAYYTGVDQSSPIDSSGTNTVSSVDNISISSTVNTSNCWLLAFIKDSTGNKTYTASNDISTVRVNADAAGIAIADSNNTVSTGGRTATMTTIGGTNIGGIAFSIAPAAAAAVGGAMTLNTNYWGT